MSIVEKIDVVTKLSKADFASDQEVRWCPGCGDYAILAGIQKVLPELNTPKENFVFVSGIGCSSRLPYYLSTYGFHTLHGRAPTVATGIKLANPELSVWVITGDGDALSIGANHLLHLLRRNINVNILLINNRIYGLTKGQYSPTSEQGKVTKSSPLGSISGPVDPVSFALNAGATFVARAIDKDAKGLQKILKQAAEHQGASFVEIYQNCHVFNDGAFEAATARDTKDDATVQLVDGEPLVFGSKDKKAIVLDGLEAKVVSVNTESLPDNALVHTTGSDNEAYDALLSSFQHKGLPLPVGVFRQLRKPTYEQGMIEQQQSSIASQGQGNIEALLTGGSYWFHE
ncbi:2-oxoacid:ferredoxin oxidoreductase subunit beta [Pseudoalteromonas rubra]|uniref:2-oxoacid:ferredoxin oxidoreductase subunit beta n=1 Tax=Pseudoalteromonas rubra TaxID=43658 RepID=A0A0F4QZC4_9GAMM|nr:2-oxoacid:ferredoxin oxidoreductase subunit beta [Pseudoalteromonas rubra]KJZ13031.1 2-oxoacid:ferredoxin oxidoreductase subunit beta [Pseudoalteromonas rubra]